MRLTAFFGLPPFVKVTLALIGSILFDLNSWNSACPRVVEYPASETSEATCCKQTSSEWIYLNIWEFSLHEVPWSNPVGISPQWQSKIWEAPRNSIQEVSYNLLLPAVMDLWGMAHLMYTEKPSRTYIMKLTYCVLLIQKAISCK